MIWRDINIYTHVRLKVGNGSYFNNAESPSETPPKWKLTVWTLNAQSLCHVKWKGNRKRRQNINVSPCKRSLHSTVCRLEQPACRGCGRRRGNSAERELSPNLSQSSHSVCYACRQPRFLMSLTQLPCTHLSVLLLSTPGAPSGGPPHLSRRPFGRYGVIR